jgi:osmotically-inducible protein OsmY
MMHKIRTLSVLSLVFLLTGCELFLTVGSIVTGGYAVVQERSVGQAIDDSTITSKIFSLYVQEDVNELIEEVGVEVSEGRVLLTGSVVKPETRVNAVRLAWQPRGVKEVINEIQIIDKNSWKSYSKDVWITTQLASRLLVEKGVRSANYTIDTVNGVVYLMGIAQDEEELDTVTYIAGIVKGVKKVISHVRLKDDPLRN